MKRLLTFLRPSDLDELMPVAKCYEVEAYTTVKTVFLEGVLPRPSPKVIIKLFIRGVGFPTD